MHGRYAAATVSAVSGRPGNASGGRRLEAFDRFYEGVRKAGMPERCSKLKARCLRVRMKYVLSGLSAPSR